MNGHSSCSSYNSCRECLVVAAVVTAAADGISYMVVAVTTGTSVTIGVAFMVVVTITVVVEVIVGLVCTTV